MKSRPVRTRTTFIVKQLLYSMNYKLLFISLLHRNKHLTVFKIFIYQTKALIYIEQINKFGSKTT